MANAVIAALLAMGAALFIAVGDVLHQRSAHDVTDKRVGHLELFTGLLRDRRWWLGGPGGRRRIRTAGGGAEARRGAVGTGAIHRPDGASRHRRIT